jgi:hypothetical protein
MLPYYLKKKMSKDLSISHCITISKSKVLFDGQLIYQFSGEDDFLIFSKDLYKKIECNYPKFYKMDNLSKLAFLAGELLIKRSKLTGIPAENVALLFANTGSTIDTDTKFIESLEAIPSPAIFVYTLPNIAIGELCIRHGWKGEGLFLIQSQFNPQELIEHTTFTFDAGNTKACLLGWVDFFAADNYVANLWLITDSFNRGDRLLTPVELQSDFDIEL